MLSSIQIDSLRKWASIFFSNDNKAIDVFDFNSEVDRTLSVNENKTILREKIKNLLNQYKMDNVINLKRKEAEIMPKQHHEEIIVQELKKAETQAKLDFNKSLEKIENDKTTITIEDIYYLPKQFAKMVAKGNARGFILYGGCGLGKSYSVIRAFREEKIDFEYLSGHITSLELYQFLFNHRLDNIILDDVNILENENNLNMLKACLNDNNRVVSYCTSSSKLKVPSMFSFEGRIILLLNNKPKAVESLRAVESRVLTYELKMDYKTKIKILFELTKNDYNGLDYNKRLEIARWIKENTSEATENLNLRLLFMLFEAYKFDNANWKRLGKALIKTNEDTELIVQGMGEKEWCEATGKHRATYYRQKQEVAYATF